MVASHLTIPSQHALCNTPLGVQVPIFRTVMNLSGTYGAMLPEPETGDGADPACGDADRWEELPDEGLGGPPAKLFDNYAFSLQNLQELYVTNDCHEVSEFGELSRLNCQAVSGRPMTLYRPMAKVGLSMCSLAE